MTLAQLRRAQGLRQIDLAQRLGVVQSRVSAIESTPLASLEWGTLRSYLEALGVHAQITATTTDGDPIRLG
jgi:transcriptional regulator with XRE-family HTH domain